MHTRTYGKWRILLAHATTLPAGVTVDADTIDNAVAEHFPTLAHLFDDYDILDDTVEIRFAWIGTVHADEDHIEEAGLQALEDDGLTQDEAIRFAIDDHETIWQGHDPADYYDC